MHPIGGPGTIMSMVQCAVCGRIFPILSAFGLVGTCPECKEGDDLIDRWNGQDELIFFYEGPKAMGLVERRRKFPPEGILVYRLKVDAIHALESLYG